MKYILLLIMLLSANTSNAQCDIKTINRPDGVTVKYFTPKPVIRNSKYEVGVAIYKNETTNDYMLSVSVLFMKMSPKDLDQDLVIQTSNTNGLRLKQVLNKQITVNGRVLANAMYAMEMMDFEELSNYNLKSVFFHLDDSLEGSTVTENSKILINELKCLPKVNQLKIKPIVKKSIDEEIKTKLKKDDEASEKNYRKFRKLNGFEQLKESNSQNYINIGDNYIYMDNKKYEATNTWTFKSSNGFGTKDNPELTIARNGNNGYAMLSAYVGQNTNMIKGDLYIFLKNGISIRCVDRGLKDFVDGKSVAIYKLTSNEIKDLGNHLISKIRYNVSYNSRGDYSSTAINEISNFKKDYRYPDKPNYFLTSNEVSSLFVKDYSGEYTSNKTVFKNEVNPKQNFIEETRFNIALAFKNNNDGMIIIQDPRIPDRPLSYRITGFVEEKEIDGYNMIIYNCVSDVTDIKNEAILFSNENGLSLMINNKKNMQAWYNLKNN